VVGAVLAQNDPVNVIAEGGVFQGSEPEAVAEQRWDASRIVTQCLHWTEHSSLFFGANPFGSPPAVEVTNEVVLMLCDLCVSAREKTRDMACLGLGKFGAYLRSGLQIKDASIRNVCAAAQRSTVRRTSEALATFLQRLAQLDEGRHAAAMARTGGREAAMSLASGKDSSGPTQTAAMEVLMVLDKLTHGEEHVDRQRPAVNPEPRYLAERKHKARLERAALEQAGGGTLAASQVGKEAQRQPVTFTFDGGGGGAGGGGDQVGGGGVGGARGVVVCFVFCVGGAQRSPFFCVFFFFLPNSCPISRLPPPRHYPASIAGAGVPPQDHGGTARVQDHGRADLHRRLDQPLIDVAVLPASHRDDAQGGGAAGDHRELDRRRWAIGRGRREAHDRAVPQPPGPQVPVQPRSLRAALVARHVPGRGKQRTRIEEGRGKPEG
jgi:hypothetical protein